MADNNSYAWLPFALLTVSMFGSYGVLLHTGQVAMGDPVNGRYKAFLWVGIAYFLVAVLAPLAIMIAKQSGFDMPAKGAIWSLLAGVAGAVGAFGILLAFGAKGQPAVVMSIVFCGAPIVNAAISIAMHPPENIKWQFFAGILLAAVGGLMVTLFKPTPAPKKKPEPAAAIESAVESAPEAAPESPAKEE